MGVWVFGSLNMDLVGRVARLPLPGETILGETFETIPGGKGANQAVAAARLGAVTSMVGRVGQDSFGQLLLQAMAAAGVRVDTVTLDATHHSGVALIAVAHSGENQIIVVPGANGAVDEADVNRFSQRLPEAQTLLLQFEIPFDAVQAAARVAHQAGVRVIVDPAPARPNLPEEFYYVIDILTPNQTEAAQLVGFEVDNVETAFRAAKRLQQRGAPIVIVKLGQAGVVVVAPDESFACPAFPVDVVDTVAAGDAFNGGLAVALDEGQSLKQAVTWASAVAAIAVTRPGAQPSMPHRHEVEAFLSHANRVGRAG
jgi:ribokinase